MLLAVFVIVNANKKYLVKTIQLFGIVPALYLPDHSKYRFFELLPSGVFAISWNLYRLSEEDRSVDQF